MAAEQIRRPRRIPLSQEEVAEIIALKRRQAHYRLHKFKKTRYYKLLNIFNIACFFVYFELIFCFYGPCVYTLHVAEDVLPRYGHQYNMKGDPVVTDIDLKSDNGRLYNLVINDYVETPVKATEFLIGKDFLLGKELKGSLDREKEEYRLFAASPVMFLSILVLAAGSIGFLYNLNENAYSLGAISVLNALTMLAILAY